MQRVSSIVKDFSPGSAWEIVSARCSTIIGIKTPRINLLFVLALVVARIVPSLLLLKV